jgi:hypothetical protein
MTDSERNIRERVAQMAQNRNRRSHRPTRRPARRQQPVLKAQDVTIPEEEKAGFVSALLGAAIVFLSVAITIALFWKAQDQHVIANEVVNTPVVERPVEPRPEPQPIRPQADPTVAAQLQTLEKRMDSWQHRTWLLALTTNETSALLRKMDKSHHKVDDRGFITMDENWRLSKVPETMALTEEQKETIRNGPK